VSLVWVVYGVFGAGALLGWRFGRSRVVFAYALLALSYAALVGLADASDTPGSEIRYLLAAGAWLVPINLAVLHHRREVGLLGARGLLRLGVLAAQALVVLALRPWAARLYEWLAWLPAGVSLPGSGWRAPLAVALALLLALSVLVLPRAASRSGLRRSWALAALLVAVALGGPALPTLAGLQLGAALPLVAGLALGAGLFDLSYKLAYVDPLTGLPGRRALEEALEKAGRSYCLAMLDVDHFKKVNDRWGHDVGDEALRMLASRLARCRAGGKAFRFGGEEFAVLFGDADPAAAEAALQRLREDVAARRITLRAASRPRRKPASPKASRGRRRDFSITVSMGLATRGPKHLTADAVLHAADQALYRAKRGGRNQVVVAA